MKTWFFIAAMLSVFTVSHSQDRCVLDLSDGVSWSEVFQAGFRPHHIRDGKFGCKQYGVDVTIKTHRFPEGINLGVGDVQFSLLEDNMVIGFAFYGRENRNLDEARQKSEAFANMFGEDVTRRAELETFETKHEVDYGGRKLDPPEIKRHVDLDTATNAAKIGEFSIIYGFGDSYRDDLPLVERLSVALKSPEAKRAKRLTDKIRPPEGYEHVSLEPNLNDAAPESESAPPDTGRELDNAKVTGRDRDPEVAEEAPTDKPNLLLWIIGGVLLLGILFLLIRAFLRGRAS